MIAAQSQRLDAVGESECSTSSPTTVRHALTAMK
jgi:hypothetical protein